MSEALVRLLQSAPVHLKSAALTAGLYTLPGAIKCWEPLPVVPHRLLLSIDDDDGDSESSATP